MATPSKKRTGGGVTSSPGLLGERLLPYLLLLPALAILTYVVAIPLVQGIYNSFTSYELARASEQAWTGLANYRRLLADPIFRVALRNSGIWTVTIVSAQLVLGLGIAMLLNRPIKGQAIFRGLTMVPWIVPSVVAALTWQWMYSEDYGVINYLLQKAGLIDQNIPWLGSPKYALLAVILVGIWKGLPFVTVTMLAGLQAISSDLYEAAAIDGANGLQQFLYVTLPGLRPVIVTVTILSCIWTFNSFDLVYVLTKGGPMNATQTMPTYTYFQAFSIFDLGYGSALGVVMLLILAVLAVLFVKVTEGSEA